MAKKKTKKREKKTVLIACRGAGTIAFNLLTPLQGGLKTLSDENYQRFRLEIEKDGFIEPISIWEDEESGKTYVLNGHQRLETLRRMKDEGWTVPQIPVSFVVAADLADAMRKILALASQYGVVNPQSLHTYASDIGVSTAEILERYSFADFDMDRYMKEFSDVPSSPIGTVHVESHDRSKSNEISEDDFQEFAHKCPRCSFEFD